MLSVFVFFYCNIVDLQLYFFSSFFFNDTATTEIYTLSLHDALPIFFFHQHFEISPDHLITVGFGRHVIASGIAVLANLAEDPGIGSGGASNHHAIATGLRDHGGCVFRSTDITIADHRDLDRSLDGGDPFPAGVAAIALLAGAGMHGYGVQAAVFGHAGQLHADNVVVVPSQAELHGEGDLHSGTHFFKDAADHRQVFEQTRAAIALDHALSWTSKVEVHQIKAGVLHDPGRF